MRKSEQAPVPATFGRATSIGAGYFASQAVATKGVNLLGHIVLAWLLGRGDYGSVALAFALASFFSHVHETGVQDVLVRRGRRFDLWAAPAFVLSVVFGVGTALMLGALSWIVGYAFGRDDVSPLIALLAVNGAIASLGGVPLAKAQLELRFPMLAWLGLSISVAAVLLSIILAAAGYGAWALVLPVPAATVIRVGLLWYAVRPSLRFSNSLPRSMMLLRDTALAMVSGLLITVTWQADYLILSWFVPREMLGLYFWAFNLSTQSLQLLDNNVGRVLLAPLARLQGERERLGRGFVAAMRLLLLVSVAATGLQVVCARPVVEMFFPLRWHDGALLVQVLSLGWMLFLGNNSVLSLMKATGEYRALLAYASIQALTFVALVLIGAWVGGAFGAAAGVAIYGAIVGPLGMGWAWRFVGASPRLLLRLYAIPLGAVAVAIGCCIGDWTLWPGDSPTWLLVLRAIGWGVLFLVAYGAMAWYEGTGVMELRRRAREAAAGPHVPGRATEVQQ